MRSTRTIRRYTAYFRGWAQAFGEHRQVSGHESGVRWLIGEDGIGIILDPDTRRRLLHQVLGRQAPDRAARGTTPKPRLRITDGLVQIGDTRLGLGAPGESPAADLHALLARSDPLHLYQTYHLIYPPGTRILALSTRAPLSIIYREISPLELTIEQAP
jgi:hypothetical protein